MSSITCQNGQLTKAEYKAGIKRELCTNTSTKLVTRTLPSGTEYVVYLCEEHSH
jgi:hypothetical protein